MLLKDRIRIQGETLFRWRGLMPLLLGPVWLLALRDSEWIEARFGDRVDDVVDWFCLAVSLLGIALRVATVGYVPRRTSGRNTRKGQVADTLNTSGLYSVVRNPLYLANAFILLGFLLATGSPWLTLVGMMACVIHYERVVSAEEAFLADRFGARYLEWAEKTPAFFPKPSLWTPPGRPFNWRSALLREYQTVFALIAAFTAMDYVEDWLALGRMEVEVEMTALAAIAFLAFLTIRFLRKRTRLLQAEPAA